MCSCCSDQFNPFYIGPFPDCACGVCPFGIFSGYSRCGWDGGNGPFGCCGGPPGCRVGSRCGSCCAPCCRPSCSPCIMCSSGFGSCGQPCDMSCCRRCC